MSTTYRAIHCCAAAVWFAAGCGARSELVSDDTTIDGAFGGAPQGNGGTHSGQTNSGGNTGTGGTGGTVATVTSGGTMTSDTATWTTSGGATQTQVIAISAGNFHTCALMNNGTLRCWGSNEYGRLGNNINEDRALLPSLVVGITSASAIDAGYLHNCARLDDETVRCWGCNYDGQLGDGTTTGSPVPVSVSNLSGVTAISAGYQHTCALTADRHAWCWGANGNGQLGHPQPTGSSIPVLLDKLAGIESISAGRAHTCAVPFTDTRAVACWGWNYEFQLGVDTSGRDSSTPLTVPGLNGPASVAAGSQHNCALVGDASSGGSVQCWGWNYYGQVGNVLTTDPGLVSVSGISTATHVSAADHSCARLRDGHVQCWGFNRSGELGNDSTKDTNVPTTVVGISDAIMVSAGATHTCALLATAQVMCWGDNAYGELGDGTTSESHVPVTVREL